MRSRWLVSEIYSFGIETSTPSQPESKLLEKVDYIENDESWLAYRCNISRSTAGQWVRAATALEDLPRIRARFESCPPGAAAGPDRLPPCKTP